MHSQFLIELDEMMIFKKIVTIIVIKLNTPAQFILLQSYRM